MDNKELATGELSVKDRIHDRVRFLTQFLKNPVEGMKRLPNWPWNELIILMGAMGAACGLLNGLLSTNILSMVAGILFFPIGVLFSLFISSGFFYYVFLFFYKREFDFWQVFTNVLFASIPALLLSVFSDIIPAVDLIGVAAALFLLIVGFSENLKLPRKKISKLMVGVFAVYVIFWMYGSITNQKIKSDFRDKASPESIDILEKEMRGE